MQYSSEQVTNIFFVIQQNFGGTENLIYPLSIIDTVMMMMMMMGTKTTTTMRNICFTMTTTGGISTNISRIKSDIMKTMMIERK